MNIYNKRTNYLSMSSGFYRMFCDSRKVWQNGSPGIFRGLTAKVAKIWVLFFLHPAFSQSDELMAPRSYEALFAADAIEIDGKALEASWQKAPFSQDFTDIEGLEDPPYQTQMKMIWDDQYLYIYAEMQEPHVWATLKQRDTVIFYNNDFEVFIDPDGDTHEYYELELNALNTVWDLFLVKPYRNGGSVIDNWDINGLQSAVHIQGTLNNATDTDTGWSVEMAIPWAVLSEAAGAPGPPEGRFWRINFSRVNWDFQLDDGVYSRKKDAKGDFLPEYNWVWSPQQVVNMHEPERWGYVYFQSANQREKFEIPEEERLKWEMYAVYRTLRKNNGQFLKEVMRNKSVLPEVVFKDTTVTVEIEFHNSGWNLYCTSPLSGDHMIITQDGQFILKHP